MKRIDINHLKEWIHPYDNQLTINENLKNEDILKYFQQLFLPNIFEYYAIILHPFWKYDLPHRAIMDINHKDFKFELPKSDFYPLKWIEYFQSKNITFNLKTSIQNYLNHNIPPQLYNEMFPNEGSMEMNTFQNISKIILETYGEQKVKLFYELSSTTHWKNPEMYQGLLSDAITFTSKYESKNTPNLFFDTEKKWAISSNIDYPFSIIGGEEKLLSTLIEKYPNEIYLID